MSRNPLMLAARNQIETPEFMAWFSGSKVMDNEGKPLIVYHGTGNSFSEFRPGWHVVRQGFYFTPAVEFASGFAEDAADDICYTDDEEAQGPIILPVYLTLKNPIDVTEGWPAKVIEEIGDKNCQEFLSSLAPCDYYLGMDDLIGETIKGRLESLGYDGLIGEEVGVPVYVAFQASQIKSATGNNGMFSPTNPNICMSRVFRERTR